MKEYDVLIIGAGPAGLTAGIYAARAGAKVGIVEKSAPGGKANLANDLENYMGTDGISGSDLMIKSFSQAEKYGAEFIFDEVTGVFPDESKAVLKGGDVKYKSLILAVGTYDRKTGVENEKEGRAVPCDDCEQSLYRAQARRFSRRKNPGGAGKKQRKNRVCVERRNRRVSRQRKT